MKQGFKQGFWKTRQEAFWRWFARTGVGTAIALRLVPAYRRAMTDKIVEGLRGCWTMPDPASYQPPITRGRCVLSGNPTPSSNSEFLAEVIAQAAKKGQTITFGAPAIDPTEEILSNGVLRHADANLFDDAWENDDLVVEHITL